MNDHRQIRRFLVGLAISITGALILSVVISRHFAPSRRKPPIHAKYNPLLPQIRAAGKKLGLDLSYMETVAGDHRRSVPPWAHPLLCEPPKSFDVLIVGDSTVDRGVIREVVSKVSGLNVGVFSVESLLLNAYTVTYLQQIVDHFLKPDGTTILHFTDWTQKKNSSDHSWVFRDYAGFQTSGYVQKLLLGNERCNRGIASTRPFIAFPLFTRQSLEEWLLKVGSFEEELRVRYGMKLPSVDVYELTVEKRLNPEWLEKKARSEKEFYFRWNDWFAMRYLTNAPQSGQSVTPPKPIRLPESLHETASAASKFRGRKVYAVPVVQAGQYPEGRSFFEIFRRQGFELMDLAALHPPRESYDMDDYHMTNTGAIHTSFLIGKWVKENSRHTGSGYK